MSKLWGMQMYWNLLPLLGQIKNPGYSMGSNNNQIYGEKVVC
ncbi:hypothetical protein [Capnocytophaga cynodegmi]